MKKKYTKEELAIIRSATRSLAEAPITIQYKKYTMKRRDNKLFLGFDGDKRMVYIDLVTGVVDDGKLWRLFTPWYERLHEWFRYGKFGVYSKIKPIKKFFSITDKIKSFIKWKIIWELQKKLEKINKVVPNWILYNLDVRRANRARKKTLVEDQTLVVKASLMRDKKSLYLSTEGSSVHGYGSG